MKQEYPTYEPNEIARVLKRMLPREKQALEQFKNKVGGSQGAKKVGDFERTILQFRDILGKPINKMTAPEAEELARIINHSPNMTRWTRRFRIWVLKRWVKDILGLRDCASDIRSIKANTDESTINKASLVTPQEHEKMMRVANTREKLLLQALNIGAFRPHEILGTQFRHWKENSDGTVEVVVYAGKTKKSRTILLNNIAPLFKRWRDEYPFIDRTDDDYVFIGRDRHTPLRTDSAGKIFTKIAKRAGITRRIYMYLERHTRLSALHKTLPDQLLKQFAGHSPMSRMEGVYVHTDDEDLMNALRKEYEVTEELDDGKKDELQKKIEMLTKRLEKWENTQEIILENMEEIQSHYKDKNVKFVMVKQPKKIIS